MSKSRVQLVLEALGIDAQLRGRQWWAICPNPDHEDRHPSWRIRDEPGSPRDGYHACPPCGFTGGVITLIKNVMNISGFEARKVLAKIEEGAPVVIKPAPSEVTVVTKPRGFRLRAGTKILPLSLWPPSARRYAESRGITEEQVDKWGIGYCDEGPLEHRIVIVTRDMHGVPRNYTARTYVDHPRRYFEPEPWEKADRNAMFGEQLWPQSRRLDCTAIVVEGAFKGLAVDRACPELAIAATAGSALMPGYLPKLVQFGRVLVSTDANETGDRIADELLWLLKKHRRPAQRFRLDDDVEHDHLSTPELRRIIRSVVAA